MPRRKPFFFLAVLIACSTALCSGCTQDQSTEPVPPATEDFQEFILAQKGKITDLPAPFQNRFESLLSNLDQNPGGSETMVRLGFLFLDLREATDEPRRGELSQTARTIFQEAVSIDPMNPSARLGLLLPSADMKEEGLKKTYGEFIQLKPRHVVLGGGEQEEKPTDPYLYLARLYQFTDSTFGWKKALALNKKAAALDPENPWPRLYMAQLFLNLEDMDKCIEAANQAIRLAEKQGREIIIFESKLAMASMLRIHGRLEEAVQLLNETKIKKDGDHWACAYQALGGLYREMGKPTEEVKAVMTASDIDADSPEDAYKAALVCFSIGDYKNADKYVDRALSLEAKDSYQVLKGHLLLFKKEYEQAKHLFHRIQREKKNHRGATVGLGHLAIIRKNYPKAAALLKPIATTADDPTSFEFQMANIGMAWILSNQNRHREAQQYVEYVLQSDPTNILAHLAQGNALIGINDLEAGERTYQKILAIQPENPYATAQLGIIHYKRGREDEAEEAFRTAIAIDSGGYSCPYEGLGLLYLKQGKIDKAKKNLKKAIEINPDIEYKKFNALAKIHLQEGNKQKAILLLQKSIENYPYNNEAKKLLEKISPDDVG